MFIAVIDRTDTNVRVPVMNGEHPDRLAEWETYDEAKQACAQIPLCQQFGAIIIDLWEQML